MTPAPGRRSAILRWTVAALLVAAVAAAITFLPVGRFVAGLRDQVEAAGPWGMVVFVLAYVAAALLFVPGSAMTLAAGAVFGLWRGLAAVSVASTLAAALGFLIARHVARGPVARLAERHRVFGAVDRAIEEGGWKVVGLLRLSPVVPFSAGNYLFGLTGLAFWPYVLASWAFMLPGTFMYVYLGHVTLGVLAEEGRSRTAGEWALLGAGLLATIAVTVWITVLARRRLAESEVAP
jgi:uncharacterized membrane protein YdjX (TVP38/TMEM64 family)